MNFKQLQIARLQFGNRVRNRCAGRDAVRGRDAVAKRFPNSIVQEQIDHLERCNHAFAQQFSLIGNFGKVGFGAHLF